LHPIAAFLIGAAPILVWAQSLEFPVGLDPYFHLAIAKEYESSPLRFSPRLSEGIVSAHPADREFLYHLKLAALLKLAVSPFFAGYFLSALASGVISLCVFLQTRSFVLTIACIFVSSEFSYRLLLPRPHVWAIAYSMLGTYFLTNSRPMLAGIVNLVYTWTYSVPVMLDVVAILQWTQNRKLRHISIILISSLIGLTVHPHFPDNIITLWYQGYHVSANALLGNPLNVNMPVELKGMLLVDFAMAFWLPILLVLCNLILRVAPLWAIVLQVLLVLLSCRIGRLCEYFVPFVFMMSSGTIQWVFTDMARAIKHICISLIVTVTVFATSMGLPLKAPRPFYRDAAIWLREKAPPDAFVFNSHWDSFPELRYFGGSFFIAQGQDPIFIAAFDQRRWRQIDAAANGKLLLEEFREAFPSYTFVIGLGTDPLIQRYSNEPGVAAATFEGGAVVLDLRARSGVH